MATMIDTEHFRGKAAASQGTGGTGGGSVDDLSKRLSAVEVGVAEIRAQLPHLATKADLNELRADMNAAIGGMDARLTGAMGSMDTRLTAAIGSMDARLTAATGSTETRLVAALGTLEARMVSREIRMILWVIGTQISFAVSLFAIAKYFSH